MDPQTYLAFAPKSEKVLNFVDELMERWGCQKEELSGKVNCNQHNTPWLSDLDCCGVALTVTEEFLA